MTRPKKEDYDKVVGKKAGVEIVRHSARRYSQAQDKCLDEVLASVKKIQKANASQKIDSVQRVDSMCRQIIKALDQ